MVEADSSFSQEIEPGQTTEPSIEPRRVGIIMFAIAFLGPAAFTAYGNPEWGLNIQVISILWALYYDTYGGWRIMPSPIVPIYLIFDPFFYSMIIYSVFMSLLFFSPRFIFGYMMYRHYKGRTSRKRAKIMGIVSELPFTIFAFPNILMALFYPYGYYALMGPIPLLAILGLALLKLRPAPIVYAPWKGLEAPKKWWDQEKPAPTVSTTISVQSSESTGEAKTTSSAKDGAWWEEEETDSKSKKEQSTPW
jgi:hypothetical protein